MLEGLVTLAAGLLGLAVGVLSTAVVLRSRRAAPEQEDPMSPELDERTTAVLDVLRSATLVVATDGRVVQHSPAAQGLGLVQGTRLTHARLGELVADVARDGQVRDVELELARGPISRASVLLQVRAAPLDGHVLILAEDRTEARRVEETRRDFVVNVSHELKTPVGALTLLAETVEDAADDAEAVRRFARRMQVEASRLSSLVHEVLELSRLQVAQPPEDMGPVPVAGVVREAVDRARTSALAKGIELHVGPQPEAEVIGDHDLLVTAVRNLLDNAVAYSDSGTHVALGTVVREGVVEIAVVDQGMGIPADALPRLFERFYRVDPARSRDTGGTGLGLSIVKHVAADHGGDVTVWSEPGQGSTFTIRLPLSTEGADR